MLDLVTRLQDYIIIYYILIPLARMLVLWAKGYICLFGLLSLQI